MRGAMAELVVDDKENTPVQGDKKKERKRKSGGRKLSLSGSKSHAHYLRVIANRFKYKGGAGRGRILVDHPLRFDGSPFEFDSRPDGEKRRSFAIFEDVADSARYKPEEFVSDFEALGKIPAVARSKNGTLWKCRALMPRCTGEKGAAIESAQQEPKYHARESLVAFRSRANAMFTSMSRPPPVAPLEETANPQETGAKSLSEIQPLRWQRGGGRRVYTQCSLDTSELEDIEKLFKKMDEEDMEEELRRHELDVEMHKYDITEEMQRKQHLELEERLVTAEVSDTHETGKVRVEEQANGCEMPPEQFNCQDGELLSPRIDGPEIEDETATVELTTPQLRVYQVEPVPKPTLVVLELGVSPESSDKAIKQLTPVRHQCSGSESQGLDSPQQIPEEVESQLEQTVHNVLLWSVELDPSRRRREMMEDYRNCRTPWLESLVHSFRSAGQVQRSVNAVLREPAQPDVRMSMSSLNSIKSDRNGSAQNLVEACQGEFLSTSMRSPSGKHQSGQAEGLENIDGGFLTCPDQSTTNADATHIALIEDEQEMRTLRDSKAILRSSRSSWPDQSPVRPIDFSAQCMGCLDEKPSESSLESPSSQGAELLRRVESVTTPPLVQASLDTIGMSPTPPRDICLLLGNPFGQMSAEDLSRRWLQFCASPSVFSDAVARSKNSWKVESTFTEATSLAPTASFPNEQLLQRTSGTHVYPNTEEEAVSGDGLGSKRSTRDEEELPNAGEEALSSGGSGGVMDCENDIDDISNDTTQIIQTGASSAYSDQEGTSALKECPQEDVLRGEDVLSLSLTPLKDNDPVAALIDSVVEYSLTHLDEENIDQFVSALQVTPLVDESRVERLNFNGSGENVSKKIQNGDSLAGVDGHPSLTEEQITTGKLANKTVSQSQDECTPVRKQSKTKRSRKSTKAMKLDSPLDAGSKWSNGKRQSTRIRSKPLDWWRGERMLYGRVHSTLNTLIGIKHLSPDPVWPRQRRGDRKNKAGPRKFKVDSFVSDEHNELLRLAAQ